MPNVEYRTVPIGSIRPHEVNSDIYRDPPSQEFIDRIKVNGCKHRIDVLPNKKILSGRRRWMALQASGAKEVNIAIHNDLVTDEDVMEFIVDSNDHHERTMEEKAREFKLRKQIEEMKAKKRHRAGKAAKTLAEKQVVANLPPSAKGVSQPKSRDIAAQQVGMKARTAEKAAEVVDAIDDAKKKGHNKKAKKLKDKLNNESVSAAHREVKPKPARGRIAGPDKAKLIKTVKNLVSQLVKAIDQRGKSGNHSKCNADLNSFLKHWEEWK